MFRCITSTWNVDMNVDVSDSPSYVTAIKNTMSLVSVVCLSCRATNAMHANTKISINFIQ